ncbi:MAG: sulfite exporter TauE/SafE family protein [Clostridia bacterium]|nr:sulfite exporter TauE/SafE family protein [Clostridia bacterium]
MVKKIIIGTIAGLISGIFSTGGGMILVPAFLYILKIDSVKARATSITCILPMVIASSIFYAKSNYLNWDIGWLCAVGGVIGSFVGSKVLNKIPDYILKLTFIIFLIYVAIKMI